MKTQNNKLVALIEMHASANENGQDSLCDALYHAINELAKTLGYEGENACDELSSNGELEIDGVCYQFDGKTSLTERKHMKTYRIETITNSKAFADFCDWYEANSEKEAIAEYKEDCHRYGVNLDKASFTIREASEEEMAIFA